MLRSTPYRRLSSLRAAPPHVQAELHTVPYPTHRCEPRPYDTPQSCFPSRCLSSHRSNPMRAFPQLLAASSHIVPDSSLSSYPGRAQITPALPIASCQTVSSHAAAPSRPAGAPTQLMPKLHPDPAHLDSLLQAGPARLSSCHIHAAHPTKKRSCHNEKD